MAPPFPSFTKDWHTTSYPSISSTNPALSLAGKTILITGGGSGIGARTVRSFAEAGAANIAILGRTQSRLESTASEIRASFPNVKVFPFPVDITNNETVNTAFRDYVKAAGQIDVLVSNAGEGDLDPPIKEAKADTWIAALDTNIKGSFLVAQAFLSGSGKEDGVVINVSSGLSFMLGPGMSSYAVSKEAAVRLWQIVSMENPALRVVSVQPGVVETDMNKKSGIPAMDDASLPADFFVWLASPEAAFLDGKYVFANWDVEEMKARQLEIKEKKLLEMWLQGYPTNNVIRDIAAT